MNDLGLRLMFALKLNHDPSLPSWLRQVFEGRVVRGDPNACGHIIQVIAA